MDHGEQDLSRQIVQGDLEAGEWWELALDLVMANFIHLNAAIESEAALQSDLMGCLGSHFVNATLMSFGIHLLYIQIAHLCHHYHSYPHQWSCHQVIAQSRCLGS